MYEVCAFTGHRNLNGELDYNLLDKVILNLIHGGTKLFLCGMAVGFDMAAAESVLRYKNEYGVKMRACIPHERQSSAFSESDKARYDRILAGCDEKIVISPEYFRGCMQVRDRYLVDNCDVLVSFLRRDTGGTHYTVKYAEKCNKNVIKL